MRLDSVRSPQGYGHLAGLLIGREPMNHGGPAGPPNKTNHDVVPVWFVGHLDRLRCTLPPSPYEGPFFSHLHIMCSIREGFVSTCIPGEEKESEANTCVLKLSPFQSRDSCDANNAPHRSKKLLLAIRKPTVCLLLLLLLLLLVLLWYVDQCRK